MSVQPCSIKGSILMPIPESLLCGTIPSLYTSLRINFRQVIGLETPIVMSGGEVSIIPGLGDDIVPLPMSHHLSCQPKSLLLTPFRYGGTFTTNV